MDAHMVTAINMEVYNRIVELVRPNEAKDYVRAGRWLPVKQHVFSVWSGLDLSTKAGKSAYRDYDWLNELFNRIHIAHHHHFFDAFQLVCMCYARQR